MLFRSTIATTAFANPASSISSSGYVKLPSGLILQWTSPYIGSGGSASVTFPIAFPTAPLCIAITNITDGSVKNVSLSVQDSTYTKTGCVLFAVNSSTGAACACQTLIYIIGY